MENPLRRLAPDDGSALTSRSIGCSPTQNRGPTRRTEREAHSERRPWTHRRRCFAVGGGVVSHRHGSM